MHYKSWKYSKLKEKERGKQRNKYKKRKKEVYGGVRKKNERKKSIVEREGK